MILMVYNAQICKEFLLPRLYDADYEICLKKEEYDLNQDVDLKLEVTSGSWELVSAPGYEMKGGDGYRDRVRLCPQDILTVKTMDGNRFRLLVVDASLTFPVMEKYDISQMKEVSVGGGEGSLIRYQFRDLVSSEHALLRRVSGGWQLIDTSSNGVFLKNRRLAGQRQLSFGDHIDIFGLHILFLGDVLAVSAYYGELKVREDIVKPLVIPAVSRERRMPSLPKQAPVFHRAPRDLPTIYREEVEIEAPPGPKEVKEKPLYLTIGPAFTMALPMMLGCGFAVFGSRLTGYASGAFLYTGLITAAASALIGVIWASLNVSYNRKESAREETVRFNAYSNYLVEMADGLREKYRHNAQAMHRMYPSAASCLSYTAASSELWNRNYTHADFLYQRIGLGDQPFQVEIRIPKAKFTLVSDSLLKKPGMIQKEFQTLRQVPVGISLMEDRLIGLVGGAGKKGAVELMHTLTAGIAASHCYTDVKLAFIYRAEDPGQEDWECMKWLPHVWSEDKSIRYMAADELERRDIFFELSNIIRRRSQEKKQFVKPHYVLFFSDPELLEGEILAKYIYEAKPEYGITAFLMTEALEQLPNECEKIIENDRYFRGIYSLLDTGDKKQAFVPDLVSAEQLAKFGQRLANIRVSEIESTSEIPQALDFFEMYGVHTLKELRVPERWRKNRTYDSMRALIGKKAGNVDCFLDIHEKFHGPHGLVAGTTGSGKSELLQTYILSLAVNFSPEDISFFLIDFKGGGMANLFEGLPHLSGRISNLSGNQVRRAMISIKSENTRRQKIFSRYGVNHINLYTKLYKNKEAEQPIPHLFIVIDEFAELKREEPEFMKELISVAQVGRSLGVHLILATQKPSGTVDDNIWSNSKFRLCLRVQDRQDSNDMLHKPDAAFITQAGRCYLQVGNDEIYELFQSGYSGAPYEEYTGRAARSAALLTRSGKAELLGARPGKKERQAAREEVKKKTQLDAVVAYLSRTAAECGLRETPKLWLPALKPEICLEELKDLRLERKGGEERSGRKWSLRAVVGQYDDPRNQEQPVLCVDLAKDGHLAVCGSAVSGKSTFLQTLVYSFLTEYTPDQLQMYLLDFSSHMLAPFASAPHVGGVVTDGQEERLARCVHMLQTMMDERRQLFKGGNYSQFVQAHGVCHPAVLVVIDNLGSFREKTKSVYDDVLLRLAREGEGYGMYLAVSAAGFGLAEIPSRIGDHIRTIFSLAQADKFKYMEILRTSHLENLPETGIRGRGIAAVGDSVLEFQTALSMVARDDFERGQKIEEVCGFKRAAWKGRCALPIPEIPEKPTLGLLCEDERYQKMMEEKQFLPMGYYKKDAGLFGISLERTYCYFISGKSRTGKTNALKILLYAARQKEGELCVVERDACELENAAKEYQAEYIRDPDALFRYFSRLLPEFARRNRNKQEFLRAGDSEEEIFAKMSEERPVFLFLADLREFLEMVYRPGEGIGNMSGFVENILEKGSLHHIYLIAGLRTEDESTLSAYRAYRLFTGYKTGLHLGGNLTEQKLFQFQNISYGQQSKAMKKGEGYVPDAEEESCGVEVVIPLAKR